MRVGDQICDLVAVAVGDGFLSVGPGPTAGMAQTLAKRHDSWRTGIDLVVALVHAGDEPLAV